MNRRDAIKSAVLGAIALPAAALTVTHHVPVKVPAPIWLCIARWQTGLIGILANATLRTNSLDDVCQFIMDHPRGSLDIFYKGDLILSRDKDRNGKAIEKSYV